jgi:hypothetical protein
MLGESDADRVRRQRRVAVMAGGALYRPVQGGAPASDSALIVCC